MAAIAVLALLLFVAFQSRILGSSASKTRGDVTGAVGTNPQRGAADPPECEQRNRQKSERCYAVHRRDCSRCGSIQVFRATLIDFDRAMDCLAATIFYEAGNETVAGQMAVVQVVLNRTRHPAYPHTVCGVVFQGHERRTGCQFSYTCDGSMLRRPSIVAWERFRALSRSMLSGIGSMRQWGQRHTIIPMGSSRKGSASLDKIRAEGTHLFFRWRGPWGTPKAFRSNYAGGEQAFRKLGLLSTVHRTPDMNLDDIMKEIAASQQIQSEVDPLVSIDVPTEAPVLPDAPEVIDKAKTDSLSASTALGPSVSDRRSGAHLRRP